MKAFKMTRRIFPTVMCCIILGMTTHLIAQEIIGLSYGYEMFPSVELVDPITEAPDLKIQANAWTVGAALPLSFSEGRIIVMNQFNYKRTDLKYENLPENSAEIGQMQSYSLTCFMIDSLSEKWKMVAVLTPGFASDFEGDLVTEDFTFGAVFGFIRTIKSNFDLGFGIAYMPDFGEPLPMPFLYLDWMISQKMKLNGLVPTNLLLSYSVHPKLDLGFSFKVEGNRYHGDPNKFGEAVPYMKYSEGTLSPMMQIHLTPWFHLMLEGGYAAYRNFEFFSGDNKVQSLDLKQTMYVRGKIVLGI
ncbi:hypothetical protein HQ585_13815 [candidate division KSB1 bacterium]|nr:hypothetical protein [candidate division KSB1 bacterium]